MYIYMIWHDMIWCDVKWNDMISDMIFLGWHLGRKRRQESIPGELGVATCERRHFGERLSGATVGGLGVETVKVNPYTFGPKYQIYKYL